MNHKKLPHSCRLIFLALGIALLGCAGSSGCKKDTPGPPTVVLTDRAGKAHTFRVEVVKRTEELARGLMYRDSLGRDRGMLFVYPEEHQRHFWMRNTYISLDMIFIGDNRRIVGVIHKAVPLTTTRREVDAPSRYVLEINGGLVQKLKIRTGSLVELRNIPGLPDS